MGERRSQPDPGPATDERPPWWLITSWRDGSFWIGWPILAGFGFVSRILEGRQSWIDYLFAVSFAVAFAYGVVRLIATLVAFRRDPSLRTREWPTPPPARGLSRRAKRITATLAILALGLVLAIFAGWAPALFVTLVLGGIAIAFDRLDLFSAPAPPLGATEPHPPDVRDADTPDR